MRKLSTPGLGALALACTLVFGGCSVGNRSSNAPVAVTRAAIAQQCQPDFTFGISTTSATITAGQTVGVGFGMTSLCGLSGTINTGVRGISPQPGEKCSGNGK